jgi:hypothetical protein
MVAQQRQPIVGVTNAICYECKKPASAAGDLLLQ